MNRKAYIAVLVAFLLGLTVATYAAKKPGVTNGAWQGASTADAAKNLLELAEAFAAKMEVSIVNAAGNQRFDSVKAGRYGPPANRTIRGFDVEKVAAATALTGAASTDSSSSSAVGAAAAAGAAAGTAVAATTAAGTDRDTSRSGISRQHRARDMASPRLRGGCSRRQVPSGSRCHHEPRRHT